MAQGQYLVYEKGLVPGSDEGEVHLSCHHGPGALGPNTSNYCHLTYIKNGIRYHMGYNASNPSAGFMVWSNPYVSEWPRDVAEKLEYWRTRANIPFPGAIGNFGKRKSPVRKRKSPVKFGSCNSCSQGGNYFSFGKSNMTHLNIPINTNWLRGSNYDNMTGLKYSWPTNGYVVSPGGIPRSARMSMVTKAKSVETVPHMHFGRVCFGS